ncbi:MAG: oxidoreductase, partial [Acidimicrobiia bacterium]|nr:oxidoreductase [Acidimicrobiia bacterium]
MKSVIVVGASLAGMRAAESLRREGFDGAITVVGDETDAPYDRPPLSKQVLAGEWATERIALYDAASLADLRLTWRLGARAVSFEAASRTVTLADGERLAADGVVIATGARPRTLRGAEGLAGVYTLRTLADSLAVRAEFDAGPQRVVVVGAGFIGAEVAATARRRGLDVTMVEMAETPLERVLGAEMGRVCAEVHADHGVDLRTGVGVESITGAGRAEQVVLSDGARLEADVVVVGVGVVPNTDWLASSGLEIDDGVVCDETCLAAPGVVAAGDVARWPNRLFGESMRVEHWDNAVEQGMAAARRLLAAGGATEPFAPVPWFWSDQYDRKIQLAG